MNFLSILVNNFSLRFRSEINTSPQCKSASEYADLGERGRDTGPGTAAVPAAFLLDPLPSPVKCVSGEADNMERVHYRLPQQNRDAHPVDVHHQRAEDVRVARNQVLTYADADY